jgi:hypothetical protein
MMDRLQRVLRGGYLKKQWDNQGNPWKMLIKLRGGRVLGFRGVARFYEVQWGNENLQLRRGCLA